MAKRAYPVIFVFAIFATLLVATIALRLAIWLPISAIKSALRKHPIHHQGDVS
jgi:hypothetical protein